jgi:hypothetical protein
MLRFQSKISTSQGVSTFSFRKIYIVDGFQFHVSVRGQVATYYFMVVSHDGNWIVAKAPSLPGWIIDAEEDLERSIIDKLSEETTL